MHVDRTRFLWLTASLAASTGCSGSTPANPQSQVAESQSEISVPEAKPGEKLAPAPSKRACRDDHGSRLDCSVIQAPAGWCEGFDYIVSECESAHEHLPAGVAQAFQECLLATSGSEALCEGPLDKCYETAIERACAPPEFAKRCDEIANTCGQPEMKHICQQTFGLFRDTPHPKSTECRVEHCLRNNCNPAYCHGRWLAEPSFEGPCAGFPGELPEPSAEE